jgi:hypothetical protein
MNGGMIGGLVGAAIGLLGGIVGTWASLRHARGPRERAFVVKVCVVTWVAVLATVGLMLGLPSPWRFLVWIPYPILLTWGIQRANREQARLRAEEAGER